MHTLTINPITTATYQTLIEGSEILERDTTAPKVLKLIDGSFLKLFRRKRWLSSELVSPYVRRFANNALILQKLNIATPKVIHLYRFNLDNLDFTAVQYIPIPGNTLRQVMTEANEAEQKYYIVQFAKLLANLHQKGIYFRSIHLGNVLVLPDQSLGLIDFADMSKQAYPLSQAKRARNLRHIKRYKKDDHWLFNQYEKEFYATYTAIVGENKSKFLRKWA